MGSAQALQRTDNRGKETQKVCWVTFLLKQLFKHFSENEHCRRIDNLLLLANCWTLGVQHLTACFYITTEEATTQTKTQVGNLNNANGNVTWKYNFILFVLLRSTFLKPRTTHSHRNQIVMSGLNKLRKKMKNSPSCAHVLNKTLNIWSLHVFVLQRTAKKCTKFKTHVQSDCFCSLTVLRRCRYRRYCLRSRRTIMFVFIKERTRPEIFASAKRGSRSTCWVILQYIYLVLPLLACTWIRSTAEKDAGNHGYADSRAFWDYTIFESQFPCGCCLQVLFRTEFVFCNSFLLRENIKKKGNKETFPPSLPINNERSPVQCIRFGVVVSNLNVWSKFWDLTSEIYVWELVKKYFLLGCNSIAGKYAHLHRKVTNLISLYIHSFRKLTVLNILLIRMTVEDGKTAILLPSFHHGLRI